MTSSSPQSLSYLTVALLRLIRSSIRLSFNHEQRHFLISIVSSAILLIVASIRLPVPLNLRSRSQEVAGTEKRLGEFLDCGSPHLPTRLAYTVCLLLLEV